jgi:hypothetical protein
MITVNVTLSRIHYQIQWIQFWSTVTLFRMLQPISIMMIHTSLLTNQLCTDAVCSLINLNLKISVRRQMVHKIGTISCYLRILDFWTILESSVTVTLTLYKIGLKQKLTPLMIRLAVKAYGMQLLLLAIFLPHTMFKFSIRKSAQFRNLNTKFSKFCITKIVRGKCFLFSLICTLYSPWTFKKSDPS